MYKFQCPNEYVYRKKFLVGFTIFPLLCIASYKLGSHIFSRINSGIRNYIN